MHGNGIQYYTCIYLWTNPNINDLLSPLESAIHEQFLAIHALRVWFHILPVIWRESHALAGGLGICDVKLHTSGDNYKYELSHPLVDLIPAHLYLLIVFVAKLFHPSCFSCPLGAFPTCSVIRHTDVLDLTAKLLSEICHDIQVKPHLQPLTDETLCWRPCGAWRWLMPGLISELRAGFWHCCHHALLLFQCLCIYLMSSLKAINLLLATVFLQA